MRYVNDVATFDATIAGAQNSKQIEASSMICMSVAGVASGGTITGTLKVQVCNDNPTLTGAPINWVDLPSATVTITGAGVFLIPASTIDVTSYQYVRVVYTKTTSAAGAAITVNVKSIGY